MINYEKFFNNEAEIKDFILLCEDNYKAQIIDIAEKIYDMPQDERKKFRSLDENKYLVVSKTKKYKHPLR